MWCGIVIGALIVLLILIVIPIDARGPMTTRATSVGGHSSNLPKGDIFAMKPRDLLDYLNSGDRTMNDIRMFMKSDLTVGQIIRIVKENQ